LKVSTLVLVWLGMDFIFLLTAEE